MNNPFKSDTAYRDVVAALAESEERYRILVEGVKRYAIFMLDPAGVIVTWNSGVQELLGYARDEFIGKPAAIVFTPEDRAANEPEKELKKAKRVGEANTDRWHMLKSGRRSRMNDLVTALRNSNGQVIGFAKVTRPLPQEEIASGKRASPRDSGDKQLATALAALQVEIEHRQQLEAALLTAIEEERQRLGQDLHDDLGQQLGAIAMLAGTLAKRLSDGNPDDVEKAREIPRLAEDALATARNLSQGLHPVTLKRAGLPAALAELASRIPLDVEFKWPHSKRLPIDPSVALHIYRVAEEAVGNAIRHAKAKKITILLERSSPGQGLLTIRDDGKGFDQRRKTKGTGLRNMHYRARVVGGSLTIDTRVGGGTAVRCTMPIAKA
jgi:PAS domain S-box-containing protein